MNRRQRKRRQSRRRAHAPAEDAPRNILDRDSYPTVKHGHIIPATFQRNFAGQDGFVSVHVDGSPDAVRMHVRKAGTQGTFYRRNRPDGTPADDGEAMLATVENKAGPLLREVANGAPLTLERKGGLAQFYAVQMVRGPGFFAFRDRLNEEAVTELLTPEGLQPGVLERAGGHLAVARTQVIEMYRDPTQKLMSMTITSAKLATVLGSMKWQLLSFDEPAVAYSDQPVVLWPINADVFSQAPVTPRFGPLTALEVRVPLSSHLAILMTWVDDVDPVDPVDAALNFAGELNAFTAAQADKQWMHALDHEPPMGSGPFQPLSREFEADYSAATALASSRRRQTEKNMHKVRNKRFVKDLELVTITRGTRQ